MTLLRNGDSGAEVRRLQEALAEAGFAPRGGADGRFGPATDQALRAFQRSVDLVADGIAGPKTMAAFVRDDPKAPSQADLHPNLKAFLDMIAHAEGTDRFGDQDGYNVIVGGELFHDYSDHPNKRVWLPTYRIHSTAAGRYQILHRFWVHYKRQLGLPDFGPESQDRYAIQQIRERRAYEDVLAGRIETAIDKCRNIWASLPGAGYGQREVAMADLVRFYGRSGGEIA